MYKCIQREFYHMRKRIPMRNCINDLRTNTACFRTAFLQSGFFKNFKSETKGNVIEC